MLELRRHTDDDQALIAAYRAGDDAAFGRIHERHHMALERYARKVLGRSSEHAEDVVQEAMLRASRALRRDDRHIELRPWLYRLTRNCALDELARVRTDSVNFDDAEDWGVLRAPAATEPDAVVESRGKVRDLLGDLAGLPAQQRHALLRREVDGDLARRARRRARRQPAGDEEPRPPRAHQPRQAARGSLERLPGRPRWTCSRRTTRAGARRRPPTATWPAAATAATSAPG